MFKQLPGSALNWPKRKKNKIKLPLHLSVLQAELWKEFQP